MFQQTEIAVGQNANPARRPKLTLINRRHDKTIPVVTHFRARKPEDFHRYAKLKSTQPVISQHDNLRR